MERGIPNIGSPARIIKDDIVASRHRQERRPPLIA